MSTVAEEPKTDRKDGRIVAIIGPVVDVEFPPGTFPRSTGRSSSSPRSRARVTTIVAEVAQHIGDEPGPGHRHEADRRPSAGPAGPQPRPGHPGPRRPGHPRPRLQRHRRAARHPRRRARGRRRSLGHPPTGAPPFDELEPQRKMFETGLKVVDLLEPYVEGRQDRPLRRRRRRQDRPHPRDDHPGGQGARRRVGLRRRGGAHPGGQRPLVGDAGVRGPQATPPWSSARWTSPPVSACGSACRP